MYKHISKLTKKDKAKILASYRNHAIRSYGMEWDEWANHIIQKEIDQIFDGGDLSRFSSVQYEKAMKAREFFNENPEKLEEKPEPLEFLIWQSMKADGTVYVPSKMPVRAELKSKRMTAEEESEATQSAEISSTEQPAEGQSAEVTLGKTAHEKKTSSRHRAGGNRRNARGMSDNEKISILAALSEMLPNGLPNHHGLSNPQRSKQRSELYVNLIRATRAICRKPATFLKHPDFKELIKTATNTHGAFKLTVSFPASFLKGREALEALKLLPLPVKIEKVKNITEATGNDEDMVTFDWFSTDDPEPDKEIMTLISEFLGEMLMAMNIV